MFADVRRGLTVAAVVHGATVTDTDGNVIDTAEFFGPPAPLTGRGRSDDAARSKPQRRQPTTKPTTPTTPTTRQPPTPSDAVSERAPV